MSRKEIAARLRQALLEEGEMSQDLFEFELQENINYWYKGLQRDRDDFVFVITENSGDVAMVLLTPDKTVHINEAARQQLKQYWLDHYENNIERFLPDMVQQLASGFFYETGVTTVKPKKKLGKRKGFGWNVK